LLPWEAFRMHSLFRPQGACCPCFPSWLSGRWGQVHLHVGRWCPFFPGWLFGRWDRCISMWGDGVPASQAGCLGDGDRCISEWSHGIHASQSDSYCVCHRGNTVPFDLVVRVAVFSFRLISVLLLLVCSYLWITCFECYICIWFRCCLCFVCSGLLWWGLFYN